MADVPSGTRVECESGRLCVVLSGYPASDVATLDALCRLASAVASAVRNVVDKSPPLDPGETVGKPPAEGPRERWIDRGVALVEWAEPPPGIHLAQQAYREVMKSKAARHGWKIFGVATIALLVVTFLVAGLWVLGSWIFGSLLLGIIGGVVIVLVGIRLAVNEALDTGKEYMDDRVEGCAVPWGIEAFIRGYAGHSGLVAEDPLELQRRLPVPVPGRAQAAWQGDLGEGMPGHLAIWIDPIGNPDHPEFWLIAAVSGAVDGSPQYRHANIDGLGIIGVKVDTYGRESGRLDSIASQAGRAAGKGRPGSDDRSSSGHPRWAGD